jgi:hypothetical protein
LFNYRGFQKFAAKAYVLLAEEENQNNSNGMSDDYDFHQIGNDLDSSLQMDWDSDEHSWDNEEEDELVRTN